MSNPEEYQTINYKNPLSTVAKPQFNKAKSCAYFLDVLYVEDPVW